MVGVEDWCVTHVGVGLVADQVVHESGARVPVAADGDALHDAVRRPGHDVVQLVGHSSGAGHVSHAENKTKNQFKSIQPNFKTQINKKIQNSAEQLESTTKLHQ